MFDEFNKEISIPDEINLSMIFDEKDETIPSIDETIPIPSVDETDNFNIIFPEVPTGIKKIKPIKEKLTEEKFKEMSEKMKLYYELQEKLKRREKLKKKLLSWFYGNNNNNNNQTNKEKILEKFANIDGELENEYKKFSDNLTDADKQYFIIESLVTDEQQPETLSSTNEPQPVTPSAPPLPSESHYMKSLKFVKTIIENMTNEYVYSN